MMDNPELMHLIDEQNHKMKEHDRYLEQIRCDVGKVKHVAITIGNELDKQNSILLDISDHMDHTDLILKNATQKIDKVIRKRNSVMFVLILIIIIIIIIIIVIGSKFS